MATGWTFVGVGSGGATSSGNYAVGLPSGISYGDLLVVSVAYRGTATFSAPAVGNWTIVQQDSNGNTTVGGTSSSDGGQLAGAFMAWAIYEAAHDTAANRTFTRTGGDASIGRCTAHRKSGTITCDGSSVNQLGSASTNASTGALTAAADDSLIVAMGAMGANSSAGALAQFDATDPATDSGTGADDAVTAAATGVWIRRARSATANASDATLAVAEGIKGTAGSTGSITGISTFTRRHTMIAAVFSAAGGSAAAEPDDSTHAQATDASTITAKAVSAPADGRSTHAADAAAITAKVPVSPADSTHGHSADSSTITPYDPAVAVEPDDATHGHSADQATITAKAVASPADAAHGHSADASTVTAKAVASPADATHGHTADSATVSVDGAAVPEDASHGHTADVPTITAKAIVSPNDASHAHIGDSASVTATGGTQNLHGRRIRGRRVRYPDEIDEPNLPPAAEAPKIDPLPSLEPLRIAVAEAKQAVRQEVQRREDQRQAQLDAAVERYKVALAELQQAQERVRRIRMQEDEFFLMAA